MESETDFREPEKELTNEQRLRIATDLTSAFFQEKINEFKKDLEDDKMSVRKDLDSHNVLFIGLGERNVELERKYLRIAKKGKFFTRVELDDPDSIYTRLKRNLDLFPKDIEELEKEKGDPGDSEVKEFREEEEKIRLIVEAIEALDEFKEFNKEK